MLLCRHHYFAHQTSKEMSGFSPPRRIGTPTYFSILLNARAFDLRSPGRCGSAAGGPPTKRTPKGVRHQSNRGVGMFSRRTGIRRRRNRAREQDGSGNPTPTEVHPSEDMWSGKDSRPRRRDTHKPKAWGGHRRGRENICIWRTWNPDPEGRGTKGDILVGGGFPTARQPQTNVRGTQQR